MIIKELTSNKVKVLDELRKYDLWGQTYVDYYDGRWLGLFDDNNNIVGSAAFVRSDDCFFENTYFVYALVTIRKNTFDDSQDLLDMLGDMSVEYLKKRYPKATIKLDNTASAVVNCRSSKTLRKMKEMQFNNNKD